MQHGLIIAFQLLITEKPENMKALLLMFLLNIASVSFSKGEEEDRDELQQGFFEVDYMLQVLKESIWISLTGFNSEICIYIYRLKC